jgi:DNA-directed RNA polymerase I subunit RPA12
MALVGTLLFCTDCGNLLDRRPPETRTITCDGCQRPNQSEHDSFSPNGFSQLSRSADNWPISVTTTSIPDAFPSALRQKRGFQTMNAEDAQTWPLTTHPCPSCDSQEMYFREIQLRSADEGSTILYRCPKCNYRYERRSIHSSHNELTKSKIQVR